MPKDKATIDPRRGKLVELLCNSGVYYDSVLIEVLADQIIRLFKPPTKRSAAEGKDHV